MSKSENEGCGWVLAAAAYLMAIWLFFTKVAIWIFAIAAGIATAAVVFLYLRAFYRVFFGETGWVDVPYPPEPAYRQYFFHKAWKDYECVVRQAFAPSEKLARHYHALTVKGFFAHDGAVLLWAPGVVLYAALLASIAFGAVLYLVLGATHLVLLGLVALAALAVASLCRLIEGVAMKWHRTFHACPHGDCHERFDLAWYYCPACNAEHRRLIPGPYGVFFRRCQCDRAMLPTFFLTGRNRLPSACPCCGHALDSSLPILPRLDIPLLGGPSAGKSSFLLAATAALHAEAKIGALSLTFTNQGQQRRFEEARALLASGQRLPKTVDLSPDAFQSIVGDARGKRLLLSWLDPAGEVYTASRGDRSQTYFAYFGAAVLLIDPFSIERVREEYAHALADLPPEQVSFCAESPEDVCTRALWSASTLGQTTRAKPLAVVITKCDVFGLRRAILRGTSPADGAAGESAAIRQWLLEQHQVSLLRLIEDRFHPVRYFCTQHASPHASSPGNNGHGETGALAPLAWIFQVTRNFGQPASP